MASENTISIIYITNRPGGYDVLFNSLLVQDDEKENCYELIVVDDIQERREKVRQYAQDLGIPLSVITSSRRSKYPFKIANAINTGLSFAAGRIVILLQDFIWLPKNFISDVRDFYFFADPNRSSSAVIRCPGHYYTHPKDSLCFDQRLGMSQLSIFGYDLKRAPSEMGWTKGRRVPPGFAGDPFTSRKPFRVTDPRVIEFYCCALPMKLLQDLNGLDENLLDYGNDCHEISVTDRAKLLGYEFWLHGGIQVELIAHQTVARSGLWDRYSRGFNASNFDRWQVKLEAIKAGRIPIPAVRGLREARKEIGEDSEISKIDRAVRSFLEKPHAKL
jgi:glycosyltransferase involved in cell wall biosynthesis